jgi:hypothetical protein
VSWAKRQGDHGGRQQGEPHGSVPFSHLTRNDYIMFTTIQISQIILENIAVLGSSETNAETIREMISAARAYH